MVEYGDDEKLDVDDEFLGDDALPVCPECFEICDPMQNYCDNCGSNEPINPLASYMPFVDLRFRIGMFGRLWRKIVGEDDTSFLTKLFFVFVLCVGAPVILLAGPGIFLISKIKKPWAEKAAIIVFFVLLFILLFGYWAIF